MILSGFITNVARVNFKKKDGEKVEFQEVTFATEGFKDFIKLSDFNMDKAYKVDITKRQEIDVQITSSRIR